MQHSGFDLVTRERVAALNASHVAWARRNWRGAETPNPPPMLTKVEARAVHRHVTRHQRWSRLVSAVAVLLCAFPLREQPVRTSLWFR